MSRQTLYLIVLSLLLLIGTLLFSFTLLIPKGKEYRLLRLENKKEMQKFDLSRGHFEETEARLKRMKGESSRTIKAFENTFNPDKFAKLYKTEFEDLYLTEITTFDQNGSFTVYEVNATSKITSPQSFYHFLEKVNKSDWIISVNFPIHFERDGDRIRSSFTMKVHSDKKGEEKGAK